MQYDFDTIIPRRGTNSYKWDTPSDNDVLPMWVADMDFQAASPVIEALRRRVEHGIFGYTFVPEAYYESITSWFARRHRWLFDRKWIIYTTNVVAAVSAIIKAMTRPGDTIIMQTPAYNCFYSSIRNNGCYLASNSLLLDENGRYSINFEELEALAADPKATLLILCNPHNPTGRVWTPDELRRVGDICMRHGVFVIADEIHCELVYQGHTYTPFASLSENFLAHSATCLSPSKSFNLAGLQIANIVAADKEVYRRIDRAVNDNEVCDVNPFGVVTTMAAYNECETWIDELCQYLWGNYEALLRFSAERLPHCRVTPLEGTYLPWVDCRAAGVTSKEITDRLLGEQQLMVNPGTLYGSEGEGFLRLNMACPRSVWLEGLERLAKVLAPLCHK